MVTPPKPHRVGFAFSGGGVRGLAHIGVIKALSERGWHADYIVGTSIGSLIGAGLAAGMDWQALSEMAAAVFWPKLLHGKTLERFCERHLPATFEMLRTPFAAVTTEFPMRRTVVLQQGHLASALSASCALRIVRRPVWREGLRLKDGGYTCVLPTKICRASGTEIVFGSDVWELSALLRKLGCHLQYPLFPAHYREAVRQTDWLVQPQIALSNYWPNRTSLHHLIAAGEVAVRQAEVAKRAV
ncbi:MAG: hypothetical protein HOP19_27680 [Acidobacteria bacterium]|nr:hypothetical protein [Acidobacteriota bacterium]